MSDEITAYPLTWPEGWKRAGTIIDAQFDRSRTIAQAIQFTLKQLELMNVPSWDVIISSDLKLRRDGLPYSNQPKPIDKGVSVWWKKNQKQQVIALNQYSRIEDNIYAIGKTLEAMRSIKRWGSGEIIERTFTGFQALPNPDAEKDWRDVLQVGTPCTLEECERNYKLLRRTAHPDHTGGSDDKFIELQRAIQQARKELS